MQRFRQNDAFANFSTLEDTVHLYDTEPIYGRARYRWTRYRRHLAPYLERLGLHITAFGYER